MSKDLIRDVLQQRALGKYPSLPKRWEIKYEVSEASLGDIRYGDFHLKYDFSVKVATQQFAPSEASADVRENAIRGIVHEIYGGVHHELWELFTLLNEEQYRSSDDPVMTQLNKIMEMTRP